VIVILYLFQSFELWKRCAQLQVETSSAITVGSNTQPWGTDKHQDTGDFIISSGTTVNMEAGSSIKLQTGFKLCNGATFKASVDGSNPMLKSSSVEQIEPPVIVGDKYASDGEKYSTSENAPHGASLQLVPIMKL
jgi:hypothetical protein